MSSPSHKSASRINAAWAANKATINSVKIPSGPIIEGASIDPYAGSFDVKFRTPQQTSTAALTTPLYQRLLTRERQAD